MSDSRIEEYLRYHRASAAMGDIDPGHAMLLYVCDRFELNREQRYWLAWLYGMTYCGPSAFYIYNEFPDFENVNVARMQRWWDARGRDEMIVQTDRRWVRSSNMFVPAFESYRAWIGGRTQHEALMTAAAQYPFYKVFYDDGSVRDPTPEDDEDHTPEMRYDSLYESAKQLYSFGQFALFLYLEALHTITPLDLCPTDLDLNKAWSCRNGLYYAYGRDDLVDDTETRIRADVVESTASMWSELKSTLATLEKPPTIWQTETILCAYRKWHRGKRYIGFYLDRQAGEIAKMQDHVSRGVNWEVLWDYRAETYASVDLAEMADSVSERGVSRAWKTLREERTKEMIR